MVPLPAPQIEVGLGRPGVAGIQLGPQAVLPDLPGLFQRLLHLFQILLVGLLLLVVLFQRQFALRLLVVVLVQRLLVGLVPLRAGRTVLHPLDPGSAAQKQGADDRRDQNGPCLVQQSEQQRHQVDLILRTCGGYWSDFRSWFFLNSRFSCIRPFSGVQGTPQRYP